MFSIFFYAYLKINKISYGIDYIIKKNETELALHTPTLHRKIIKYIKKEHIPIEIFTREQLTMQLRKSNCFIENKTVRFKDKTKKADVLDIKKIEDKNIDIQFLKPYF